MSRVKSGPFGIVALLLFVSSACARRESNIESVLAPEIDLWKRSALSPKAPDDLPPEVRRFGVRSAYAAAYHGPGRIDVDLYQMNSDAVGLDLVQKWRPAANTVVFHRDRWFAVVRWDSAERDGVTAFVRALEKQLAPR